MDNLLEKTRKISELLHQKNALEQSNDLPYANMAVILGDALNTNTYIIDETGKLLGYRESNYVNEQRILRMLDDRQLPREYTEVVKILSATEANIPISDRLTAFPYDLRENFPNGWTTVVPIFGANKRLGTIILGREDDQFNSDDLVVAEYAATVVGMQMMYQQSRTIEEKVRKEAAVQMAINTLSYSAIVAVKAILGALDGEEGRLTASQIADEIGITRSVIVNALRKLESAGVIESRSLGMKGTYLRILIPSIVDEIQRLSI